MFILASDQTIFRAQQVLSGIEIVSGLESSVCRPGRPSCGEIGKIDFITRTTQYVMTNNLAIGTDIKAESMRTKEK